MKREITGVALLIAALLLSLSALAVTRDISGSIVLALEKTEEKILAEGPVSAQASARELSAAWERQYQILSAYIPHEHLEHCELAVVSLQKHLDLGNGEMALLECEKLRMAAEHLHMSEKPALWNIF